MIAAFLDLDKWPAVTGEAIYDSSAWDNRPKNKEQSDIFYTLKGGNLFIIGTTWLREALVIEEVKKADRVSILGSAEKVEYKFSRRGLVLTPPEINPGNAPCEHAWVFKVENFR